MAAPLPFHPFSREHLITVLIGCAFIVAAILLGKRGGKSRQFTTGALAFIDDALAAAGPLADELAFDAAAVQIPLVCIGTGRWQAHWLAEIGVEDAFTGRGQVPAGGARAGT